MLIICKKPFVRAVSRYAEQRGDSCKRKRLILESRSTKVLQFRSESFERWLSKVFRKLSTWSVLERGGRRVR